MEPSAVDIGYDHAVRLPLVLAPTEERMTGTAAPVVIPISRGKAQSKVMAPVTERACTIPMEAEADCRSAVNATPISMM